MKVIIKILEYLPERDGVIFRTCRLNSHKPIDEYPAKVVDCHDLNKNLWMNKKFDFFLLNYF